MRLNEMATRRTANKTGAKTKAATKPTARKAPARKTSRILETVHETARDFYEAGIMDLATMREFDALCLPEIPNYSPAQIKGIRMRCKASQAVFAKYMNISPSALQKWEIGEKKPSNIALKLLNVVDRKGLEALV